MARSRMTHRSTSTTTRNLYNKGVSVPNGTFNQGVSCDTSGGKECTVFRHTLGSWAIGANYEITPQMSAYGRINQGVHFPGFDDLRSGTPQTQKIDNYQIGLTEGNARIAIGSGSGIANNFEMARPIFGRQVTLQLRYKF
jgi:hypothetical protein